MIQTIAINARYTHRRPAGVERYARELSVRLEPPVRSIASPHASGLRGHLWEQFSLPRRLRPGEVLWSPANSGPWAVRCQAITLHDASPFDHPEWFHPNFAAWTRLSWRILAQTCAAVITVSDFSRQQLKAHLLLSDQKLYVVPNGVGKSFSPATKRVVQETLDKYAIRRPYFFFTGTHEPRKNLGRLFLAWERALSSLNGRDLVVAGEAGAIFRSKGYHRIPPNTQLLGYVPEADLPALYSGAAAVIIPSLYEGFCLPVLEAMACGAPVITSNAASLIELTAGAALMVEPLEPASIAQALLQLSSDPGLANKLRERGLKQARQFSWDTSALQLQSILRAF